MRKKGVVLVISLVILAVLLVLTGAYFSGLLTEKRAADNERFVLQALGLAEAGANHAQSELRERIRTDLKNRVNNERKSSTFNGYVINNDSLGFLRDFAYATGDSQFVVSGNEAVLELSALNLNTQIQGSYTSKITVKANGLPTSPSNNVYIFPYNYMIEAQGSITSTTPNIQKKIRLLQGSFTVTVRQDTLAKFALFTNHHRTPQGGTVWFTADTNFTGPVSTNERFSFANNPSAHFTEAVTQHEKKARFYNRGWPILIDADNNLPYDNPTFDRGFLRGQDIINLESSISQSDLRNEALGTMQEPGQDGIYIPNNGTNVTGGIYIRGNSTVNMSLDANSNAVYTIRQGQTTKSITVDYINKRTQVQTGQSTETYQGLPDGVSNEGILIYAKGDITSFSGTVQKDSAVTVSSERDIVITGHIQYQQYNPGPPLNANGYANVLGILSWGGDVRIGTAAPNNVNIHGVVMAPHGIFTVDNYRFGSPRGTATILGGVITDFYGPFGTFWGSQPISGYARNFIYDTRMLRGVRPPYFPYLSNFTSSDDGGLDRRLIWQDKGG